MDSAADHLPEEDSVVRGEATGLGPAPASTGNLSTAQRFLQGLCTCPSSHSSQLARFLNHSHILELAALDRPP